jgi:mannose-6-phosphate isomerase
LLPGIDAAALAKAIDAGKCEECLSRFRPRPGDCVFLPAGTVHALGGGVLVTEIQQTSDTTYRLFDWNRLGPDGQPRPLHIRQALSVINYQRGPIEPQQPRVTDQPHVARLVECDQFVLDRWTLDQPVTVGGDGRFHMLAVLSGSARVEGDASTRALTAGDTLLLPASLAATAILPAPQAVLMDAYLP